MTKRKAKPQHGGAREGAGRPAGSGEHYARLDMRVKAELKAQIIERASEEGIESYADWVRETLERALARPARKKVE